MGRNSKKSPFLIFFLLCLLIFAVSIYPAFLYWRSIVYPLKYKNEITKASKKNSIDFYLIAAMIREESRFNPQSVSSRGAIGLMQIMPQTALWIKKKASLYYKNDSDLYSPKLNITMGTWYIAYLKSKYNSIDLALAAYNGGTANVDRWQKSSSKKEDVLKLSFAETSKYVKDVKNSIKMYKKLYPNF